jgi:hypothetical protein
MASSLAAGLAVDHVHRHGFEFPKISKHSLTEGFSGWLVLASYLGDSVRLRISNMAYNPRQAIFDTSYIRTVTSNGQGTWNQFEMDMLENSPGSSEYSVDDDLQ